MTAVSELDAILFDCDGVLVDSETLANRALLQSVRDVNLPMTEEEIADTFTGQSFPECIARIEARLGHPVPADFVDNNRRYFRDLLLTQLTTMPGVPQMLAGLSAPYAVVTNSQKHELEIKMQVTGLERYFPLHRRFDTETMGVAKPDPAIYVRAAGQMGVDIRRCLIIEDSLPGLKAATGSGARVWAYRPHPTPEELAAFKIDRVFDDWNDFLGLLNG